MQKSMADETIKLNDIEATLSSMKTIDEDDKGENCRRTFSDRSYQKQFVSFINDNFRIRHCYKYRPGETSGFKNCECNRHADNHTDRQIDNQSWSYENNTRTRVCDAFGKLHFINNSKLFRNINPLFIRFDSINQEKCPTFSEDLCRAVYLLLTRYWNLPEPKLIISINGGFKRTRNITNQQKKNFKQGLMDVIKKSPTWIIGGGFNVGISKMIGEVVCEYNLHLEDDIESDGSVSNSQRRVTLIGVCTWGVIYKNHTISEIKERTEEKAIPTFKYENDPSNENGKVTLDGNYDCFLFCDDGTEKQYDKEIEFRLKFEKFLEEKERKDVVQVLFEGGKRAVKNVHSALQNSLPVVIIKGSGRAANLISEVLDLPMKNKLPEIKSTLLLYEKDWKLTPKEIDDLSKSLLEMSEEYKKNMIVYNMTDEFDKHILEAIIKKSRDLKKTLHLALKFDCPEVADRLVFSHKDFKKLNVADIREIFLEALKNNNAEFLKLFLENDFDIEKEIKEEHIIDLYKHSLNPRRSVTAELLKQLTGLMYTDNKLTSNTKKKQPNVLKCVGRAICTLSGNLLVNEYDVIRKPYANRTRESRDSVPIKHLSSISHWTSFIKEMENVSKDQSHPYGSRVSELFLWALLSAHTNLAEILWKAGKDHIGSAMMATIILKNMNTYMSFRGESDLMDNLILTADHFEELAMLVLKEAHKRDKKKTVILLIRCLNRWNNVTCIDIAMGGQLLEFLHQSACKSYTFRVWLGELNPFIPVWKILFAIPFPIFLFNPLMPSFLSMKETVLPNNQERNIVDNFQPNVNVGADLQSDENACLDYQPGVNVRPHFPPRRSTMPVREAIKIFYAAPVVKFSVYLVSYIVFLMIFAYMNLVELKPFKPGTSAKDIWAEIFVYVYLSAFVFEEVRQILDENRSKLVYKMQIYVSNLWNKFDIAIIVLFIASTTVRFTIPNEQFMVCRCLFAITLSAFCLRMMQFYFANETLGPKVIMIRNMLRDLLFFLSIFGIFLVSYGLLAHSLNAPNSEMNLNLFRDIFYMPYFQTYGELMLPSLLNYTDETPAFNATLCATSPIDVDCWLRKATTGICFAAYLLLTNILMINLLIAMFGHTFNAIQEKSQKFWSYILIMLVEEFYEKPILPPPFNVLFYVYQGICWLFKRCGKQNANAVCKSNLLRKHLTKDETFRITGFEQLCMESVTLELEMQTERPTGRNFSEYDIGQIVERIKVNAEAVATVQKSDPQPSQSFQVRTMKRLESLEEKVEKLNI